MSISVVHNLASAFKASDPMQIPQEQPPVPPDAQLRIQQLERKMSESDSEKRELQRQVEELVEERERKDMARKVEELEMARLNEQLHAHPAMWMMSPSLHPQQHFPSPALMQDLASTSNPAAVSSMRRVVSAPNLQAKLEQQMQPENRVATIVSSTKEKKTAPPRNLGLNSARPVLLSTKDTTEKAKPSPIAALPKRAAAQAKSLGGTSKPGLRKNIKSSTNRQRLVWTDGMRQRFMLSIMQIGLLHHASPTSLCTEILANPCFAKYMATKLHCSYTLLVSRHASSRVLC
jgi:hypothetical protein